MPTNEERREVAARLRNWESFRETFMESPICAVIDALGVEGYLDWRGVFELLADLIEPEQERTCTVEGLYSPGYSETDWGRCSRCCGVFPYQDDVVACPKCGAKVVEE